MKRLLLLLAGLLIPVMVAGGVNPGRLLVIYPGQTYNLQTSTIKEDDWQRQEVIAFLHRFKIPYDMVPASACNTWMVRRGTVQVGNNDSLRHVAVLILGFQVGRFHTGGPAGFNPESLTLQVCAPVVPVILSGVASGAFQQTSSCSTGTNADNLGNGTQDSVYSVSPVNCASGDAGCIDFNASALADADGANALSCYGWKAYKQNNSTSAANGSSIPPGIWRPLLEVYTSRLTATDAPSSCINCDQASQVVAAQAAPKFQMWYRDQYGLAADLANEKPLYFVHSIRGAFGVTAGGMTNLSIALANADSTIGGALFGTGAPPLKISFVITSLYKRRSPDDTYQTGIGGLRGDPSDVVSFDSTAFTVGMDSVASYCIRDKIPVSFAVEADSVNYFARDKSYALDRFPNWKVFPYTSSGNKTTSTNAGNCSPTHPIDVQLYSRSPGAFMSLGATQPTDSCYVLRGLSRQLRDTCLACRASFALNVLKVKFGSDRVSPTIMFYLSDYANGTGYTAVGRDSFFSAFSTAGYSTVIINNRGTSGSLALAQAQFNWSQRYRTKYGNRAGTDLIIASDGHENSTIGSGRSVSGVSEIYAMALLDGILGGVADFQYQGSWTVPATKTGPTSIVTVDVGHFGIGINTGNNMVGYRTFKYVANPIAVMNKMGWRRYIVWDWPENVTVDR